MACRLRTILMTGALGLSLAGGAWAQTPPPQEPDAQAPDVLTPPPAQAPAAPEAADQPETGDAASAPLPPAPATGGLGLRDLAMMDRAADPQLSPDGRQVLYSVRATDWDENTGVNAIWLADVDGRTAPRELAASEGGASHARWSDDGRAIYFLSSRGGSNQIWRMDRAGAAAAQVTTLPVDVGGFEIVPGGGSLLVAARVFVDCDTLECTRDRLKADEESPATVTAYDRLPLRIFDHWYDGRRGHLFVQSLDGSGLGEGAPRDLTPGFDANVGGPEVSPDGRTVLFATQAPGDQQAFSSNADLWRVPIEGGAPVNLTPGNPAADRAPALSPDGRRLAWLANSRDEIAHAQEFDFIVVNDVFNTALDDIGAIIRAQRLSWAAQSQRQSGLISGLLQP